MKKIIFRRLVFVVFVIVNIKFLVRLVSIFRESSMGVMGMGFGVYLGRRFFVGI